MINPPQLEEKVPIDPNDNQYLEVIRQASADLAYYYILKIGSRIDNYSTDGLKSYIDAVVDDHVVDTVL